MDNKPEKFGVERMDATAIQTKLVRAHKAALECHLINSVEVSDHILYIAKIVEAHCVPERNQLFSLNGYGALGTVEPKT